MNRTKNKYGKNYFGNLPSKQIESNKKIYTKRYNGGDCLQSELGSKTMKRKWLQFHITTTQKGSCVCCNMKDTFVIKYRTKEWKTGIGRSRVELMQCNHCYYSILSHGGSVTLFK